MPENKPPENNKKITPDWLVRGILTKIGDTFDKLTGRGWKPSSSLATSELIEKLKALMDLEVKDLGEKGRYVPHNFKLKMQWDKFATDSNTTLQKLETELLTAAIDHINDNRYHTFAPVSIEVKPDYFTEGVQLLASFEKVIGEEEEVAVKVTVPEMNVNQLPVPEAKPQIFEEEFVAEFMIHGLPKSVKLHFKTGARLSVGRSAENDLTIEDASVSKIHASLVLNNENRLLVADTGSTNGTFINNERIAYGKAFPIENNARVAFGTIPVIFKHIPKPAAIPAETESIKNDSFFIDGFEFKTKSDVKVENPEPETLKPTSAATQAYGTEQLLSLDLEKNDNPK